MYNKFIFFYPEIIIRFINAKSFLYNMIAELGLIFIITGWFIQFAKMWKKKEKEKLSYGFLIVYIIGVALLVADGMLAGLFLLAWLNVASMAGAVLVMLKLRMK